ncbi:MAG: PEP/pyruvate-binding domain-containing protein, partial [Thermoanaerobaculia bacterium]
SADPWLGIPVKWDQISGANAIVEAEPRDLAVDPSQGSHFFQNITAFMVGYFTVSTRGGEEEWIDWEWLAAQPALEERGAVRHVRLDEELVVKINGHQNRGVILKPGVER